MRIGEAFNPYKRFIGSFIPNCLLRYDGLTPSEKLCYARLAQYAGENGHAYPAIKTLAKEIAIGKRQVINLLKSLEKKGFLRIVHRRGTDKVNETNVYIFLHHEVFDDRVQEISVDSEPDCTRVSEAECTNGSEPDCTQRESSLRESIKESIQDSPSKESTNAHDEIVSLYHDHCHKLPSVAKLTDKRRKVVKARLKEYDMETIEQVFKKLGRSKWHTGDNPSKWKANFDWIMNPNNFVKILEMKIEETYIPPPDDYIN